MQETIEQYKQRIMGYTNGQNPLKVQAATAGKIGKLIKGVPKARLTKRPAPGKWSVGEILAHLADSEIVAGYRMRSILGAPGMPIASYDQDKWAEAENYAKHDPHASLDVYRTLRDANLRLMKSLRAEQWKQFGLHAERGEESVEKLSQMMAGHDLNHLGQIVAILSPKKK
ncbi:MAG: DinB family protein [Candidatus Acidiferrales bacterium]